MAKTKRIQRGADYANPAGPSKGELERRVVKAAIKHAAWHERQGSYFGKTWIGKTWHISDLELRRAVAALKKKEKCNE